MQSDVCILPQEEPAADGAHSFAKRCCGMGVVTRDRVGQHLWVALRCSSCVGHPGAGLHPSLGGKMGGMKAAVSSEVVSGPMEQC